MPQGAAPGERRGGRAKGTRNKRTQEQITAAEQSGLLPLDYMLLVLRDVSLPVAVRLDAASKAAPYIHPKLSTSKVDFYGSFARRSVREMTDEELYQIIQSGEQTLPDVEV